jgi:serine/threonine protein kinase
MQLNSGGRLGVYQVIAQIGAGGMGEVYRARDTWLDRDVALKLLPEAFAGDPEGKWCRRANGVSLDGEDSSLPDAALELVQEPAPYQADTG